jgi:hypothetical protein
MTNPGEKHYIAAKRIARYLKHTIDVGLTYTGDDSRMSTTFHGYEDADWAGDIDDRRSTTEIGWTFMLNNGPSSFNSTTQHCSALQHLEDA